MKYVIPAAITLFIIAWVAIYALPASEVLSVATVEPVAAVMAEDVIPTESLKGYLDALTNSSTLTFVDYSKYLIAVCDPHRAFKTYQKVKDRRAELAKAIEAARVQGQAKQKAVLDSEKLKASPEELIELKADLKAFLAIANDKISTVSRTISQDGYADVYAAIAKVAEQRGVEIVLSKEIFPLVSKTTAELRNKVYLRRPVLYSADALDITDDVIEMLNREVAE